MRQGLTLTLNPTPTLTLTLPQAFKDMVAAEYDASKVRDGVFGAMMDVALINDGPVTLVIESLAQGASPPTSRLR